MTKLRQVTKALTPLRAATALLQGLTLFEVDHAARSVEPLNGVFKGGEHSLCDILNSGGAKFPPAKWLRLLLNEIGIALSTQRDRESLLRFILQKCREITHSDAGSLYLVEENVKGERSLGNAEMACWGDGVGGPAGRPYSLEPRILLEMKQPLRICRENLRDGVLAQIAAAF